MYQYLPDRSSLFSKCSSRSANVGASRTFSSQTRRIQENTQVSRSKWTDFNLCLPKLNAFYAAVSSRRRRPRGFAIVSLMHRQKLHEGALPFTFIAATHSFSSSSSKSPDEGDCGRERADSAAPDTSPEQTARAR